MAESTGTYLLSIPYSVETVALIKSVPGMVWVPELKHWRGYSDAIAEVCALTGHDMPERSVSPPYNRYRRLRPYQQRGVSFLIDNAVNGAILADCMGAGKTFQTIVALGELVGKALIVCPSFVRGVWRREFEKWQPDETVQELEGTKPVELVGDVVICHYDILHAHADVLSAYVDTVVFDEAHFLSNEKSRRSKAAKAIAAKARNRIALTGTPVANRPRDLWNIVDTISPGRFGSFFKFATQFCGAVQQTIKVGPEERVVWNFDGRSNLDVLKRRLSHFMLRRTFEELGLELPPKTRQVVELKVASKARLEVIAGASGLLVRRALDAASDGKLREVVAAVRQHVEDGYKVVVFTHRRVTAEHIARECGGWYIHGGVVQKERDCRIEEVKHADTGSLLAATIDSASTGIDLSFASVCVFAELTYEPAELAQAEARVYRFGQQSPVLIQYFIALGTIEEFVRDKVIAKLATIEQTVGLDKDGLKADLEVGNTDDDALRALLEGL